MRKTVRFIYIGAAAAIAGCGGGGAQNPAVVGSFVPPGKTFSQATASLTIQIPARATKASRHARDPKWISPSSTTIGVRVLPVPLPNPTPTENSFTLPTPGPAPTSVTLQVQAPVATDTFVASAYDGSHNLLATGSSAPTAIAPNAVTNASVTMLGVASGVQYTIPGVTPAAWRVLENSGANQSTTVSVQPVDADNNLIPGTLASPATLSTTGGVMLSASTITGAGTITATFPSGTSGSGSLTSPLVLNAGASALNAAVNGDYYIFTADNDGTVRVIDGLMQTQVGTPFAGLSGSQQIAALSGCSTGAFAVSGNGSGANVYSVAAPTTAAPTPLPAAAPLSASILSITPFANNAVGDTNCNAYYNDNNSGYPLTKLSGFDSTITANPTFATGFSTGGGNLQSIGGQIYSPFTAGSNFNAIFASAVTGGAAASSTPISLGTDSATYAFVAGSGSSVFLVADTCSGQPVMQSLSGGPIITLSQFENGGALCCPPPKTVGGVAQATDGTIYIGGFSVATGNPSILAYGPMATIGTAPTVAVGAEVVDVAVTPDQQFVCVLEKPTGTSGQIEFFRRMPSPALVATVPLSGTSAPSSFSIGP